MSAQAITYVWDIRGINAEERLCLLWIANCSGGLGQPYCPEWIGMGEFIGSNFWRAEEVVQSLLVKGLLVTNKHEDEGGWSALYIVYDGPYEEPIDWTVETKGRSARVKALIERDGPQCSYCDKIPVSYEVDHFIPRAKGGDDLMTNLVLACPPCNRAKRDKHPLDFCSSVDRYDRIRTNLIYVAGGE
jgi:hypothetical protein